MKAGTIIWNAPKSANNMPVRHLGSRSHPWGVCRVNQALKWVCAVPDRLPDALRDTLVRAVCTVVALGGAPTHGMGAGAAGGLEPKVRDRLVRPRRPAGRPLDRPRQGRADADQQLDEGPLQVAARCRHARLRRSDCRLARQLVKRHERAKGHWSDAAAHQLLSQRLVRLQAPGHAATRSARPGRQLQRDTVGRIGGNLERLLGCCMAPTREAELAAVMACWARCSPCFCRPRAACVR